MQTSENHNCKYLFCCKQSCKGHIHKQTPHSTAQPCYRSIGPTYGFAPIVLNLRVLAINPQDRVKVACNIKIK